jgi:hypothetical protein
MKINPDNVSISIVETGNLFTRFVINAGYAESTRAASLELRHEEGFTDVMTALRHLVETLEFVAGHYDPNSFCRTEQRWADPGQLFLHLHIEELDIIAGDSVEERLQSRGWHIFPDWTDESEPVYVQNFLRLIDEKEAFVQWQYGKIESSSYDQRK